MREKNKHKKSLKRRLGKYVLRTYRPAVKKRFIVAAGVVVVGVMTAGFSSLQLVRARADECPDLRVVFVRGSGAERYEDKNYLAFKDAIIDKIWGKFKKIHDYIDLNYPAVAIGTEHLGTTAGAYFGSGDAYEFGQSVEIGRKNLTKLVNNGCPNTKYVIGGYSQGAMVVSKALSGLKPEKIIYAATFGDPKIYLPEGAGLVPAACKGKNLSDYRMYVPDCQAYRGKLGSYIPYEPYALEGKLGTWCNKRDFFCSSRLSMADHTSYVSDGMYEDASRVIFSKIAQEFNIENTIASPHDTAIMVDVSKDMDLTIERNAGDVVGLVDRTIAQGGRVALYSYNGSTVTKKYCDFGECTADKIKIYLEEMRNKAEENHNSIENRLMTSSFTVMDNLNWQRGATKSLVAITNKRLVAPDLGGTSLDKVVRLSKTIDPVNFYILADSAVSDSYSELAERTDGMVSVDEVSADGEAIGMGRISERILTRFDSLPRVEELEEAPSKLPILGVKSVRWVSDTEVEIAFETDGVKTMVTLNDGILGMTEERTIRIGELDRSMENNVSLTPIGEESSGEVVKVDLNSDAGGYGGFGEFDGLNERGVLPKAPNTGKAGY